MGIFAGNGVIRLADALELEEVQVSCFGDDILVEGGGEAMFTGLINDFGSVRSLEAGGGSGRITIALPMDEIAIGDSIAINGVCLTVVTFGAGQFSADVSAKVSRVPF